MQKPVSEKQTTSPPIAPALVHVFTGLGAVAALMSARALNGGDSQALFVWLFVALFIDGIDGTFARAVNVKERLPRFSGERLDLVVDYLTYVFVPVLALLAWRHLDGPLGLLLAAGILLSSLYHFSDTGSKTEDNCFTGFPAVWNIVAFYVFAFDPPQWVTAASVALCIFGTFVPMPWVHPLRVVSMRVPTAIVTIAALLASTFTLFYGFPAPLAVQIILAIAAAYYIGQATWWWLQRR